MSIYATIYLLIAVFALGAYLGASVERNERLALSDSLSMGVLAALWPVVLAAFVYVWTKDKLK